MVIAGLKLVQVQGFEAGALSAAAEKQRVTSIEIPASRGSIVDRNGVQLAFSVEVRTLSVTLAPMHKAWDEYAVKNPRSGKNFETEAAAASKYIAERVPGNKTEQELLDLFHKNASFTYLVDNVEPSVADDIIKKFPEINAEKRSARQYPGGSLASNVVGFANWNTDDQDVSKHNLRGLVGLESYRDNDLAGIPGKRMVNTAQGNDNVVIPGTERDFQPATPGSNLELTIDSDLQYDLQSKLSAYVAASHAKGGSAVIMDAKTAEVYALANDTTYYGLEDDIITERFSIEGGTIAVPKNPGLGIEGDPERLARYKVDC